MQSTKWELYEYQRSRSFIDLGPNHSDSIFLNFFSSVTVDFKISSALRWVIQDQWSSGLRVYCIGVILSRELIIITKMLIRLTQCMNVQTAFRLFVRIWAASWQNQQNGMCAPRKFRSAWASAQTDQSSLCTQGVAKDPSFLHVDSEDSDQTGRIWVFVGRTCHLVGFVMRCLIWRKQVLSWCGSTFFLYISQN